MKIKPQHRKGGYSNHIAQQYVDLNSPIYLLSDELEPQQKYENNKPTGEIVAYKAWFGQKGLPPFQVKFTETPELPDYLSLVSFEGLMACEVNYNVYFKADGLKEVN